MNKPLKAPRSTQIRFALATGLTAQLKPVPPTVSDCPACHGEGYGCTEECWQTGRIVEGGAAPGPLATADYLRALVAEEMSMEPRHRVLTPTQLKELCVHAESCSAASQRISRLEDELAETREQLAQLQLQMRGRS